MARLNEIQEHFTQVEKDDFDSLMTQLETLLQPKLINLTEEENVKYGSIGEKNKLFVNKVNDYHTTKPTLSSRDVDWAEFEADYADRFFLENAALRLEGLMIPIVETKRVHDFDNYQNALLDYKHAQYKNASQSGKGYEVKVRELGQFFTGGGSETDVPE